MDRESLYKAFRDIECSCESSDYMSWVLENNRESVQKGVLLWLTGFSLVESARIAHCSDYAISVALGKCRGSSTI